MLKLKQLFLASILLSTTLFAQEREYNTGIKFFEIDTHLKLDELASTRRLPISIFYPTNERGTEVSLSMLMNNDDKNTILTRKYTNLFNEIEDTFPESGFLAEIGLKFIKDLYRETYLNLKVEAKPAKSKYPIIIFSPGAGLGKEDYSLLIKMLSGQGVVVIAIDHPQWEGVNRIVVDNFNGSHSFYNAEMQYHFRGNRISALELRTKDLEAVKSNIQNINQLINNIGDTSNINIAGHSYGGHTAFLSQNVIKARNYINIDGSFAAEGSTTQYLNMPFNKGKFHLICALDCTDFNNELQYDESISHILPLKNYSILNTTHGDFTNFGSFAERQAYFRFEDQHHIPRSREIYHNTVQVILKIINF